MVVAVRVDSSLKIGIGHLVRCLTLASELTASGAEVIFLCKDLPGNMARLAYSAGFKAVTLGNATEGAGSSCSEDAQRTRSALAHHRTKPDWLVVDHYSLDAEWEAQARSIAASIMVIDDLADRPHNCDLLVDQNLHPAGAPRYKHLVPNACTLLEGPQYAMIRPEFRQHRQSMRARSGEIHRILVFFGGTDPANVTSTVVPHLVDFLPDEVSVDVVIGASNPNAAAIEALCSARANMRFYRQTAEMAELMAASDLMIGAGGTTTWERCCLGLPSITITIADNQTSPTSELHRIGATEYLGAAGDVTPERLRATVMSLLQDRKRVRDLSVNCGELVDGLGSSRIVSCMHAIRPVAHT